MNLLELLIAFGDCHIDTIEKYQDDKMNWHLCFGGDVRKVPPKMPRPLRRALRFHQDTLLGMVKPLLKEDADANV